MDRLKLFEIKKLLKELEFIESDFEYRNIVVSEADSEFLNSISEFLEQHPDLKKLYDDKITEKVNKTIEKIQKDSESEENESEPVAEIKVDDESTNETPDEEEIEEKQDKKNTSQIKKLYREIVKLTHPDKVKSKKLNELYIKATDYYESNNKIGIYAVCNELNIEYQIEEQDITLIIEQISHYKNKINFLESTFTWNWYNCKDEAQKNQILVEYIKMRIR